MFRKLLPALIALCSLCLGIWLIVTLDRGPVFYFDCISGVEYIRTKSPYSNLITPHLQISGKPYPCAQ